MQTMHISRELQFARINSLRRCVPLSHAVMWIYLVSTYSTYSVLKCPKVEFFAFFWNQLVPLAPTPDFWAVLHVGSGKFDDVLQCQWPKPQRLPVAACPPAAACPYTGRCPSTPDIPDDYMYESLPFTNLPDGFDGSRTCGKLLEVPFGKSDR